MLEVGKKAPSFRLASSLGGEVSPADFAGKFLVLYFYPKDDTPGCTLEAQDFRDKLGEFSKRNAVVIGVSPDSLESHQKFCSKYSLPFALLSDPERQAIDAYGAWGEKNMYGKKSMGLLRTTVVIAPDGKVSKVFSKVKVEGHADKVLQAIDAAVAG